MHGAGNLKWRAERRTQRLHTRRIVEAQNDERAGALGPRQHLEGHARHDGERPPASANSAAEIIARDVLHDAPATAEGLPRTGDRLDTEKVIARATRNHTTAAGKIRRKDSADRAAVRWRTKHRPEIDGLEGEHLALLGEALLDVHEWRTGARAHDEFRRLIERDAAERGRRDSETRIDGTADRTLGAGADHLHRHLGTRGVHDQALKLALASWACILHCQCSQA